MRFEKPLLRLPIRFNAEVLRAEVDDLSASAWMPHPTGFAGNDSVPLVTPNGELTDLLKGPMGPTEHLARCPYAMAIMGELGGVWGRSRLMGLAPGAEVPGHVDIHYYWRTHIRIHIPVVTNPGVTFTCGGETVHMAAGECWIFDSFQVHTVQNKGQDRRVHLVLDTVGGGRLWELIEAAQQGVEPPGEPWMPAAAIDRHALTFEQVNAPKVMSPWEIRCHVDFLSDKIVPGPALAPTMKRVEKFIADWQAAWAQFGESDDGTAAYRQLIQAARQDIRALAGEDLRLVNEAPLPGALDSLIFSNAVGRPQVSASAIGEPLRATP